MKFFHRTFHPPFHRKIVLALLLITTSGCTSLPSFPALFPSRYDVDLQLDVTPASSGGVYEVSGTTNLPENTTIAVAALRYLHPHKPNLTRQHPLFSILDYREVEVEQGQWQAELNLWKVASDGRFQEVWQKDPTDLVRSVKPDPQVVFVAMLPPNNLPDLEEKLVPLGLQITPTTLRSTQDGDRYLQVSQAMAIDLPTGKTNPPPVRPEDINGGWGNRYLILPEPPNLIQLEAPTERQTNAPVSFDEMMR